MNEDGSGIPGNSWRSFVHQVHVYCFINRTLELSVVDAGGLARDEAFLCAATIRPALEIASCLDSLGTSIVEKLLMLTRIHLYGAWYRRCINRHLRPSRRLSISILRLIRAARNTRSHWRRGKTIDVIIRRIHMRCSWMHSRLNIVTLILGIARILWRWRDRCSRIGATVGDMLAIIWCDSWLLNKLCRPSRRLCWWWALLPPT